jgi:alpha-L-rhamnosidase
MFALAFGLVNSEDKQPVLRFIQSRGLACSVYGSQFLMDAIYEAGEADYGLELLTSQAERSWYNMIREGSTITMEAWGNKFKPNQDWNHAWGAVPANIIPRKLMGIEPLLPGWSRIKIQPQLGSLKQAYIKVPTIKGDVTLDCTQQSNQLAIKIEVPANTQTQVVLPLKTKQYSVELNGIKATVKKLNNTLVLPDIPSGNHRILITYL